VRLIDVTNQLKRATGDAVQAGPGWWDRIRGRLGGSRPQVAGGAPPLLERGDLLWLALALIVGVGLRADWILYVNPDPYDGRFDDSLFYEGVARGLALGRGYVEPWLGQPTAQWPPAYPAALAVLYKLFGQHILLAKGFNVALGAICIVLVYIIARRIFDRRVAALGALTLAAFPGQIYFSTLILTETLFATVFLLVILLALLWTVERDGHWWQVLLLGALIGYAALVRAEGIFLALMVGLLWLFTVRPWRRLLLYAPVLVAGVVLTLTPWTVRNAIQLHQFVPMRTSTEGTFALGLDPDFEETQKQHDPKAPPLSDVLGYWRSHSWEIPGYTWTKLRLFYEDDEDGIFWIQSGQGLLSLEDSKQWMNVANTYFFTVGALALLAIPLCLTSRRRERAVILIFGLGWSLLFVFTIPQTRYHFPVGPLASILAAGFVVFVWDGAALALRRTSGQRKTTALAEPDSASSASGGLQSGGQPGSGRT
jgi:4-amino-4-deoxy-L-arabinose transferase-like glycosyltransferase